MTIHYPPAARAVDTLVHDHTVQRIWARDISVWRAAPGSAEARSIQTRLGWLDVAQTMTPELGRIAALADAVKAEGIRAVYLLGMGGSSLCAEVIATVFGTRKDYPHLTVLDTTDEHTITAGGASIQPA